MVHPGLDVHHFHVCVVKVVQSHYTYPDGEREGGREGGRVRAGMGLRIVEVKGGER